ncbi:MAG: T9SS type A sorting domain-containing protein, partial [Bacteroidetes bacterium]|nr:T9SS type A sorting domain-containing protein [Bacteroidota bacterium]
GCTDTETTSITVHPLPTAVITPSGPTTFCQGGSVTLSASGGMGYLWSTLPTTSSITVSESGNYQVTVTNANGCTDTETIAITVHPLPTAVITPSGSTTFCQGGSVTLSASGGTGYLWSTLATTSSITVTQGGNYHVTVTNESGCSDTSIIIIDTLPMLPVSLLISPSSNPVIIGTLVYFVASSTNSGTNPLYQWMVNGTIINGAYESIFAYIPSDNDTISCILTSSEPCISGNPAYSNAVIISVTGIAVFTSVSGVIFNQQIVCYDAIQTIAVAGNTSSFSIQNGGSATLIAGENILFLPGTMVVSGGFLHGYITADSHFCGWTAPSIASKLVSTTDLEQGSPEETEFVVYPNPVADAFAIKERNGRKFGKVTVEVYNMTGKSIMKKKFEEERIYIRHFSEFPAGCYFIKIVGDTFFRTAKFVKSKE